MLDKEFGIIREYITHQEKENLKISKANVGWHLDHSLKVVNNVLESLKNSNSDDYKKNFNGMRLFAFTIGFFPRGKAKAPKRVLPPEVILKEDIENQLEKAVRNFETIDSLKENQFFTHPVFQQLNKKQTIKFLRLHTNHHLKIVRDIVR
ncbi:MAG: DUF1569 domain-containing protein [Polaribacter sp.]|nr:DUF1569 domain-containing protein [Polaribacter sp.]MBT4413859.1 DUF1569 domain-containing protein [Polaribacter sp.]MBT7816479.1 DUF1569 domain-containing protein [Polaribacter sp.]